LNQALTESFCYISAQIGPPIKKGEQYGHLPLHNQVITRSLDQSVHFLSITISRTKHFKRQERFIIMANSTHTPPKTPTRDHQRQTLTLDALRLNLSPTSVVPSRVRRLPQRGVVLSHQQEQRAEESRRLFLISKLTQALELVDEVMDDSCGYFDDNR
jgi:hypothetical protein